MPSDGIHWYRGVPSVRSNDGPIERWRPHTTADSDIDKLRRSESSELLDGIGRVYEPFCGDIPIPQ
jgi:hypothetical protein